MRELKIRKWYKNDECEEYIMAYINLRDMKNCENIDLSNGVTMQYTGYNDINNKEIFEDDIVRTKSGSLGVIKYGQYSSVNIDGNEHIGFYIKWIDNTLLRVDLGYWLDKIEVAGNMHENNINMIR